ncbi:L-rhamnose mutarotase [Streptomyces sp. FXJ1.4098]|uniref:L-rhamnose mutarotase n=1 Tax=Streptomyces sp. NPDC020845 TaxID=3365096 RepID=UPI002998E409|nr:L-rhamnose mutarotase [Streptomyces sp. FXJ1.4098]
MKRLAQVFQVLPEKVEEYRALHRDVPEPVLDRLRRSHIANYSIRLLGDRLFACFEYHGDDLAADLAAMAENPATQAWWRLTAQPPRGRSPYLLTATAGRTRESADA